MKNAIAVLVFAVILVGEMMAQNVLQLEGRRMTPFDIAWDNNGNKIMVGQVALRYDHDLDPGPGTYSLSGTDGQAGLIASYSERNELNYVISISDEDIRPTVDVFNVEVDDDNNIYVVGTFIGKADLDPGPAVVELQASTVNEPRSFLASYDDQGQLRFAFALPYLGNLPFQGGLNFYGVNRILEVDASGNSYLLIRPVLPIGFDLDPGAGEYIASSNLEVISYDQMGQFRFGYPVPPNTVKLGCGRNGTHFIIGTISESSSGQNFDFAPGEAVVTINDIENSSFFFASYSSLGALNFVKVTHGPNAAPAHIGSDADGNIYITGKMSGVVDFDPGAAVSELVVSEFEFDQVGDFFLAKYNINGDFLTAYALQDLVGQVSSEHITEMEVDQQGNVYLIGLLAGGSVDFDPSSGEKVLSGGFNSVGSPNTSFYMATYDSNWNLLNAYKLPHAEDTYIAFARQQGCNVYALSGRLNSSSPFDFLPDARELLIDRDGPFIFTNAALEIAGQSNCLLTNVEETGATTNHIRVYPNPSTGPIQVQIGDNPGYEKLEIFNALGRRVYTERMTGDQLDVDLQSLPNGFYFLQLSSLDGRHRQSRKLQLHKH